jgi:cyclic pyranopterin monophosphate synthase
VSDERPLSHLDARGEASMVDVSAKAGSARRALAEGHIAMSAAAFAAVRDAQLAKGDVIGTARIAGILAAKRTAELIPLCHPLALSDVQVRFTLDAELPGVRCEAEVRITGPTGVEMEALTAVSVALLTVYDMVKSADKSMTIGGIVLVEKDGGKSGAWRRSRK